MKLESIIELTPEQISEIILDYLRNKDTKGITYKSVNYDITGSSSYGDPYEPYQPAILRKASVKVELEVP